jgi:hypothetical protein
MPAIVPRSANGQRADHAGLLVVADDAARLGSKLELVEGECSTGIGGEAEAGGGAGRSLGLAACLGTAVGLGLAASTATAVHAATATAAVAAVAGVVIPAACGGDDTGGQEGRR